MKFLYMLVIWFVITTLLYFMISVYSRSVRREKLEKQWAEDHQGGDSEARTAYIENGMVEYEHGFRKKLIVQDVRKNEEARYRTSRNNT